MFVILLCAGPSARIGWKRGDNRLLSPSPHA